MPKLIIDIKLLSRGRGVCSLKSYYLVVTFQFGPFNLER